MRWRADITHARPIKRVLRPRKIPAINPDTLKPDNGPANLVGEGFSSSTENKGDLRPFWSLADFLRENSLLGKNLWFTYSGNWLNDLCDGFHALLFLLLVKYPYLENCLYEIGHFVGQFAQLVRHSIWLAKELNFVKALWCIKLWKVWKSFHDCYFSWHIQPDAY